jgi:hypothetical protein
LSIAFDPQALALPFQPPPAAVVAAADDDDDEAAAEGADRRGGGGGGADMSRAESLEMQEWMRCWACCTGSVDVSTSVWSSWFEQKLS